MKNLIPLIGLLGCEPMQPQVEPMETYTEDNQEYIREDNPSEYLRPDFQFPEPDSLDIISGEIVVRGKVKNCFEGCH